MNCASPAGTHSTPGRDHPAALHWFLSIPDTGQKTEARIAWQLTETDGIRRSGIIRFTEKS